MQLSPWAFRFKRAAGQEWISIDPYWQDEKPLMVWFFADGAYERRAAEGFEVRFCTTNDDEFTANY